MVAMAAKGDVVVTINILVPDAFATAFTGGGVVFLAIRTNDLPVPLGVIIIVNKASAALTIQGFFLFGFYFFAHLKFLRKMKIALPNGIGRALCLGLIFFCQEHGRVVGVVNDIDLLIDWIVKVNHIFLAVFRLLGKVVDVLFSVNFFQCKDLKVILFFW